MLVTETQKYVFTAPHTNERYRWIPLDKVDRLADVEVCEEGNILSATTGVQNNQLWIKWPHTLNPPESPTFVLKYRVIGGLQMNDNGDQVYWKVIFADRDVPILSGKVTVRLPGAVSTERIEIRSFGVAVNTGIMDGRTIEFSPGRVDGGQELEVQVTSPHSIVHAPAPTLQQNGETGLWLDQVSEQARRWMSRNPFFMDILNWFFIGIGALFIIAAVVWILIVKHSRNAEPKVPPLKDHLPDLPDDLPPALVGRIPYGSFDFMGDIYYLSQRGYLTITEVLNKHWYGPAGEI